MCICGEEGALVKELSYGCPSGLVVADADMDEAEEYVGDVERGVDDQREWSLDLVVQGTLAMSTRRVGSCGPIRHQPALICHVTVKVRVGQRSGVPRGY